MFDNKNVSGTKTVTLNAFVLEKISHSVLENVDDMSQSSLIFTQKFVYKGNLGAVYFA